MRESDYSYSLLVTSLHAAGRNYSTYSVSQLKIELLLGDSCSVHAVFARFEIAGFLNHDDVTLTILTPAVYAR